MAGLPLKISWNLMTRTLTMWQQIQKWGFSKTNSIEFRTILSLSVTAKCLPSSHWATTTQVR